MSSAHCSYGADPENARRPAGPASATVTTLLFESLCYVLIEKGVLTKNDALGIVQTVAQVKAGRAEAEQGTGDATADLRLLRRMFTSLEALHDRASTVSLSGANVHRLRPPLHAERPEFPQTD